MVFMVQVYMNALLPCQQDGEIKCHLLSIYVVVVQNYCLLEREFIFCLNIYDV